MSISLETQQTAAQITCAALQAKIIAFTGENGRQEVVDLYTAIYQAVKASQQP